MPKYLISPAELAAKPREQLLIIDCRFSLADVQAGRRSYQQSHISGAHYLHLDEDLSGPKGRHGGRHPLPDSGRLQQRLQALGMTNKTLVVAYDDQRMAFAARLWWLLRYLGHEQVKVLDGGFKAWQGQGLPCDAAIPSSIAGDFIAAPRPELLVNREAVIQRGANCALIDSREAPRYRGEEEPIDPIAGHIEGAVNYPWQSVTGEQGQLLTEQQQPRWQELLNQDELMVYCGSGVTACVNLLSLAEAGREDAKLYAGSWSDWCSYL
ncbi:sulfurtransferase [Dasania sp. GY-MA-18]|uniref:Sulfurtransferase n=1 Tax=Dasania phycosphaerae TaxID=2950436 RepID=A0A9J6RHK9_9GAMM|nr:MULTISPECIES: sulfurtransferase [Dasania]MCR8921422.1 sulfurtransferase [Dasania sp. GY-MA-18]MCZ0863850.1 sulfurtransferase [Dasania phycosphaerae]MCZ0867578.1 sulfurtransferase [Dasania phycosphaerae]